MPHSTWRVQASLFLLLLLYSCQQSRWEHRAIENCVGLDAEILKIRLLHTTVWAQRVVSNDRFEQVK